MALFNFAVQTPEERALREAQARRAQQIANAQDQYNGLLGKAPVLDQYRLQEGPLMPGQPRPTLENVVTQGSGLLGNLSPVPRGTVSPQEALLRTAGMENIAPNFINAFKEGALSQGPGDAFGGTGIKAQAYNQVINYNRNKLNGAKTNPTEDMAYNLAYQQLAAPSRYRDADGRDVEVPGMDMSTFLPPIGMKPTDKKVGPKKPLSAEAAGKLSMMDAAEYGTKVIKPILFKNGNVNKKVVKEMYAIDLFGPSAYAMSPDAQKLFNAFEYGKQAITRVETGAAMPPSEVKNTAKRFMPRPWDDDSVIKQKWEAYNLFINNVKKYLDPNNIDANTADQIFERVTADIKTEYKEGQTATNPKTGEKVIFRGGQWQKM